MRMLYKILPQKVFEMLQETALLLFMQRVQVKEKERLL